MTLTKADLVQAATGKDLNRKKAAKILETLLEIIKGSLEKGEDVLISGFGKFCVREKKERRGRNPATGEDLILNARRVTTFKCSPVLAKRINEK